jgi:hypothetical protein
MSVPTITTIAPKSARNCCSALNPHKAIVLPNPHGVYYKTLYPQCSARIANAPVLPDEHRRYGTIDLSLVEND